MMSVYEYAVDMNKSLEEILKICKQIDIDAKDGDYELSDDEIILLDNEIANMDDSSLEVDDSTEFEEEFEDSYVSELKEVKVTQKKKKKPFKQEENNKEYAKQKKEMYKHKEKLQSNINTNDDTIVIYSEGKEQTFAC